MDKSTNFKYFIGIDVSKKTLDLSVLKGKDFEFHVQIDNSIDGLNDFLKLLKKQKINISNCLWCAENTGVYNEHLKKICETNEMFLWIEKPLQIIRSQGITRGKNDKIDSKRIALFAYKNQDTAVKWLSPRNIVIRIKRLISLRRNLMNNLKQVKLAVNEKTFLGSDIELLCKSCELSVNALKQDVKNIEKEILKLIQEDAKLNHMYKLITSIDGIGMFTAVEVIISTNEFKNFDNAKKFACYCGVVPFDYSSGTSVFKKARVSPMANINLKTLLHMSALSSVAMQGEMREYFTRKVSEGKNKMSVLNAIRNKLILRIFAVIKKNQSYQKDFSFSFA